jgi:hypothetical protein
MLVKEFLPAWAAEAWVELVYSELKSGGLQGGAAAAGGSANLDPQKGLPKKTPWHREAPDARGTAGRQGLQQSSASRRASAAQEPGAFRNRHRGGGQLKSCTPNCF